MGRRWFSSARRVFSSKVDNKGEKSKKKCGLGKSKDDTWPALGVIGTSALLLPPSSAKQIIAETGNGENQHTYSVAIATAVAAEAAAAVASAVAEIVRLTASLWSAGGGSREEIAAIKIQTAFRDYLLGEDWNDSPHSKEQMEAKLQKRQEAGLRREKTLTYAYSHQWRSNSSLSKNPTYMDPSESPWGWSWLEHRKDRFVKSGNWSIADNIAGSHSLRPSYLTSRQLPSTPPSIKGKSSSTISARCSAEDDRLSLLSFRSQRHGRRHIIGGAPSVPGYLSATESTRAKSRFQTLAAGNSNANVGAQKRRSPAFGFVRKQLSFSPAGEIKTVNSSSAHTRRFYSEAMA